MSGIVQACSKDLLPFSVFGYLTDSKILNLIGHQNKFNFLSRLAAIFSITKVRRFCKYHKLT